MTDAPETGHDTAPGVAAGAAFRVLVVDDDEVDRLIVRRHLARSGVEVALDEAATTGDALRLVAVRSYDCVILDYNMPGGDGLTLLRGIRRAGLDVPVIALTGQGDEQVAVALMKAGAADYVPKGALTPERLGQSLRYAVELARAAAATQRAERERAASAERTARLQAVTAHLAAVLATHDVARLFATEVCAAVDADTAWIGTLDADGGMLRALASVGLDEATDHAYHAFPVDTPLLVNEVLRARTPRYFGAAGELVAAFPPLAPVVAAVGVEALAVLPLDVGGDPFGAMALGFRTPRAFGPDDRAFLGALAQQCAQALDRGRLYEAERASRAVAEDARREAEEANKAKSEFLARMSHDLRTPLNAIAGYAQLIEEGVYGETTSPQRDALARIRRAQQHLLALINDILSFAKLEAGQVRVEVTDVPVGPVVRELAELTRPGACARGLALVEPAALPPALVVRADRERLMQVLLNLTSNAVKFTPAGQVRLDVGREDGWIIIDVADTGMGIPADRLEAIFNPFVQARATEAERRGGVGLGLAIGRELTRMMGGELSVASTDGAGSTFRVRLPSASEAAAQEA